MMDAFLKAVKGILPKDRIYTDELRTLAWGADASEYKAEAQDSSACSR